MNVALGFIGAALLLFGALWIGAVSKRKKIGKVFEGRESLTDTQFFEQHFSSKDVPKLVTKGVRRILSEQFGEDMSRLLATDDFTKNLKFLFETDSLVSISIAQALEDEFNIKLSISEAQAMNTVEDIVLGVSEKLEQRNKAISHE